MVEDGYKKLSVELLRKLPNTTKNLMIQHLVSARQPVLIDFINKDTDIQWLHSAGYLYQKKGDGHVFITHRG